MSSNREGGRDFSHCLQFSLNLGTVVVFCFLFCFVLFFLFYGKCPDEIDLEEYRVFCSCSLPLSKPESVLFCIFFFSVVGDGLVL